MSSANETLRPPKDCLSRIYDLLEYVGKFAKVMNAGSLLIFFFMVLLTFVNVVLRYVFKSPLTGVKEYTEVLLIVVVAFSLPLALYEEKLITVDIITSHFKPKFRACWDLVISAITSAIIGLLCYQSIQQALYFLSVDRVHGTMTGMKSFPFQLCIAFACFVMCLLCIRWILGNCIRIREQKVSVLTWIALAVVVVALFTLGYFMLQKGTLNLSNGGLALLGILLMLALIFAGMPTGFAIMLVGFLLIGNIRGPATALDQLASNYYSQTSNYTWAVVGFFMLMGSLCFYSRLGDDIYDTVQKYFGRMRGGLAIVTVGASACLSGIMGDSTSVASTMANIAYPQMKKYGYHDKLATGTIAAGSLLGPLIPPSTGFIIFATLTGVSLGKLFVAGIVPGLVMAIVFIAVIMLTCRRNPEMGPRGPRYSRKERISSLKQGVPILVLFLLVIGGVYLGIFSATEGGSVGVFGALLIALFMRRLSFKKFFSALLDSGSTLGMIFMVIIGAGLFSRFLAWCNLSELLTNFFLSLNFSPKLFMLVILIFFFIMGFFVDIIPMLLLGIPIFFPIATAMGLDSIWFAVLLVMTIQTGVITPPFASLLFAMKGMMPGVKTADIFNGVWPFVVATGITILILYLVPGFVTWLPNLVG